MKIILALSLMLMESVTVVAQSSLDSVLQTTDPVEAVNSEQPDTVTGTKPSDTIPKHLYNKYGDLLNDDPEFNPKYPWWLPSVRILGANLVNWAAARYIYKFDWAVVTPADWKNNLQKGPEWDADGFGINFIGHPHTGNYYYNIARSNGYSFWETIPFVIQGSLTWEYLGENTRPSWNDLINTPLSGMFLGEVFYRLSSNILDDRTRGAQRLWREFLAGVINPPRFFNRLTQGKLSRVTSKEVYQKEPLNITLSGGIHKVNDRTEQDNKFATGSTNAMLNIQFDYGDPFETRYRKPFDVFRFRIEMGYGHDKRLLDHVNGYGILTGKNLKSNRLLGGLFQHFDYWRNNIFEVASLGFGGGLISRMSTGKTSNIYSNIHLAIVPLGGNNTEYGPDTSEFRHYNFGGGMEAKVEETINLSNRATIGFTGFYYWIHTYNGLPGNSLVGILKPRITLRLFKNMSLGFEHHIYQNDRYIRGGKEFHVTRTEQKLFLEFFFEDPRRYGNYH